MIQLEEGMLLYHGSYSIVGEPDLHKCAKYKDLRKWIPASSTGMTPFSVASSK